MAQQVCAAACSRLPRHPFLLPPCPFALRGCIGAGDERWALDARGGIVYASLLHCLMLACVPLLCSGCCGFLTSRGGEASS
eukprot:4253881-Alexandrium_andersonii.AAC.1